MVKVGDKFIVISRSTFGPFVNIGDVCEVVGVGGFITIMSDNWEYKQIVGNGNVDLCLRKYVEVKVGDIVRIKNTRCFGPFVRKGDVATVIGIDEDDDVVLNAFGWGWPQIVSRARLSMYLTISD